MSKFAAMLGMREIKMAAGGYQVCVESLTACSAVLIGLLCALDSQESRETYRQTYRMIIAYIPHWHPVRYSVKQQSKKTVKNTLFLAATSDKVIALPVKITSDAVTSEAGALSIG